MTDTNKHLIAATAASAAAAAAAARRHHLHHQISTTVKDSRYHLQCESLYVYVLLLHLLSLPPSLPLLPLVQKSALVQINLSLTCKS